MKRRFAFVANSSTSSFLIFGVERDVFEKAFPDCDDPYDMDLASADGVIGYEIFFTEDSGVEEYEDVVSAVTNVKAKLEKLGLTGGKFYYGALAT